MTSVILGRGPTLVNSGLRFLSISAHPSMAVAAGESSIGQPMADSGTIQNWYMQLAGAPGAGTNYSFAIAKNGVATSMVITIADTATTGQDTDPAHAVSYVAGDRITIQITPTGTPATGGWWWSIENVGTDCPVLSGTATVITSGVANYASFQCASWNTVINASIIPTNGTITAIRSLGNVAAGAGNTITVTLVQNGVDTALTCSFGGTGTKSASIIASVPVSQGDLVYWRCDPGASATSRVFVGANFSPFVNGESIQCASAFSNASVTPPTFYGPGGGNASGSGTETLRAGYLGTRNVYLRKLIGAMTIAPGVGKSWSFRVRTSVSATPVVSVVSDTATTSTPNNSDSYPAVPLDWLSVGLFPSGSPAAAAPRIGYVTFIDPALSPITEQSTLMAMGAGGL